MNCAPQVALAGEADVLLSAGGTVSMPALFLSSGAAAVTVRVPGLGGADHEFEDNRLWARWAHVRTVRVRRPPKRRRGLRRVATRGASRLAAAAGGGQGSGHEEPVTDLPSP